MSYKKTSAVIAKIKWRAITAVEMLVALFLAIGLLTAISNLYAQFYQTKLKQNELLMLQKESHQLLTYLQQHIQHLGYQGVSRQQTNFRLFEQDNKRYAIDLNGQCFIFFYDLNDDGCLGKRATKHSSCINRQTNQTKDLAKEVFGIKLERKSLYIYDKNNLEHCSRQECRQLLNACREKWRRFTSEDDYWVERLHFTWLEEPKLLRIALKLTSKKQKLVSYEASGLVYILNH
ncbi:hypothetical protein APJL_1930 [Actinobacillus pleuropneumoniae serovar 3 str. JL03]|uniref:Type II secretory pathway, component PulJ n=2 Tax=Actinobacillus pleuropneumoniae TaxID=715 RepID=B0BTG6_ACTPJ|nr:hypothetical protein APJL_1930 [Actinobacillus pleuropneumoniae serovar 3 str. JL03]